MKGWPEMLGQMLYLYSVSEELEELREPLRRIGCQTGEQVHCLVLQPLKTKDRRSHISTKAKQVLIDSFGK